MKWPRDGSESGIGYRIVERAQRLQRLTPPPIDDDPEWEVPDVVPYLFAVAVLVIFAALVLIGAMLR